MPDAVEAPKIGLIAADIDIPDYTQTLNVQLSGNDDVKQFIQSRNSQLVEIGEKLVETGMNVLFCSREVHPAIIEHLASKEYMQLEEFAEATWKDWLIQQKQELS